MEESPTYETIQRSGVGRSLCYGLIAVGICAIFGSPFLESRLKPMWFWPPEDRRIVAELQTRFDKLYVAFVLEKNRRSAAGQQEMLEPPAVDIARKKLHAAKASLRLAKQRPAQIATALRWGGTGCCLLGLILLRVARRLAAAPSPAPEA